MRNAEFQNPMRYVLIIYLSSEDYAYLLIFRFVMFLERFDLFLHANAWQTIDDFARHLSFGASFDRAGSDSWVAKDHYIIDLHVILMYE